jgi:serine/threonine-protein phosphatase 2A activator
MAETATIALEQGSMAPPKAVKPKYTFVPPQKLIKSPMDMANWDKSEAYYDLIGFISSVCMCIQGKSLKHNCQTSQAVQKLLDMLAKFERLAIETPPVE